MGRCDELPVDHWHGHHPPPPAADDDAGVDEETCGPEGLYADRYCKRLARGVIPYTPRYELWADGADKQRFIFLPEGKQIDTSNPDRWTFPEGTRLYKTFSLEGKKLETRVFRKTSDLPGILNWTYEAFAWGADQRSVEPVGELGAENVLNTEHDIPTRAQCVNCHDQTPRGGGDPFDIVNGFEAIQLNHEGRGWTLARLIEQDRLQNSGDITLENSRVPGTRVDQAGLGYLHSNCGNCHGGKGPRGGLDLSIHVGELEPSATAAYQLAASCKPLARWTGRSNGTEPFLLTIDPGSAATSGVIGRMDVIGAGEQMPPIGRQAIDDVGIAGVSRWIDSLALHCDPPPPPTP
jgi:hypothetical protein